MYCSNCGKKNEADAKFCSNCGTKLEKDDLFNGDISDDEYYYPGKGDTIDFKTDKIYETHHVDFSRVSTQANAVAIISLIFVMCFIAATTFITIKFDFPIYTKIPFFIVPAFAVVIIIFVLVNTLKNNSGNKDGIDAKYNGKPARALIVNQYERPLSTNKYVSCYYIEFDYLIGNNRHKTIQAVSMPSYVKLVPGTVINIKLTDKIGIFDELKEMSQFK